MRAMFGRALSSVSSLALVLTCVGCGGGAPPAHDATGAQKNTAAPSPTRRGPSDEIKKAWAGDELAAAVYIDVEGLLKTKLMASVMTEFLPLVTESMTQEQLTCLDHAFKAIRELAVAASKRGTDLFVARFDPAATSKISACIATGADVRPATVGGAAEAWTKGKDIVIAMTKTGLIAYGAQHLVEKAIAGRGNGKTLEALSLDRDEYVAWTADLVDGTPPMKGSILVTDDRFRIRAQGDAPNAEIAERIENGKTLIASTWLSEELPPEQANAVKRIVAAMNIKRSGAHLDGTFDLHGTTEQVATDIGTGAALAIYSVRRYIVLSKQAEALNTVGQLARILGRQWQDAGAARAKKKLVSFPPTPQAIPKGVKYQSSSADWKPWAPLAFEMTAPQYYQYEIKAAKDGKSADIIARGDLNGDGTASEFKLTVKVGPDGQLVIPDTVAETNPNE